jgi:glycosyltransferase involved in cell wall biosynthesis
VDILYLVLNVVGKGTYRRALFLGRELVQRGHTVTLMATDPRARLCVEVEQREGVTLVSTPDLFRGSLRSGWDLWNAARRVAWLRGRRYDIVHGFETRPTVLLPLLYAKYGRGWPVVLDWADWFGRGGSVEERANPLLRAALRPAETFFEERFRGLAARTTVICSTLMARAQALGVPAATLTHLPNGCDTARFFPVDQAGARQRVKLGADGPIVGYCGTIFPQDARLMAAAFDRLVRLSPGARLLVIGYCPVEMAALVAHPQAVIQTGFVEDDQLNDYFNACDLGWLPLCDTNANRGRWPMKLNDYMAAGLPTVATAVGDVADLLAREPIGLLAPVDPDALAQQTARLLADTPGRSRMGRRARELALADYSWAALAARVESLYEKVI